MDLLQEQVTHLNGRIDALYTVVERLSSQTTEVLTELRTSNPIASSSKPSMSRYHGHYMSTPEMEHKDVLIDSTYPESDSQQGDRVLAPEVQIQRLTAQLTAAYNRIAALEEQLLSRRVHS